MISRTKTIRVAAELVAEAERRVAAGEFRTVAEAVETALRYYLDRHSDDAWAAYVREEVEAGLHGRA